MTRSGRRLLDLIVKQIGTGRFVPGDPKTYLGYKKAHDLLGLSLKGGTWGRSLQIQGLNDLGSWSQENKHIPAITGLIVDTTKGYQPGHGFFVAFNKGKEDFEWWREEVRRVIGFDWSRYSKKLKFPTQSELEDYEVKIAEGRLTKVSSAVRKRCELLLRTAKSFFRDKNGKLVCAVCSWQRPTDQLRGDIVEIHHLRPLASLPRTGVKWSLQEALKYLRPLCPNCHRIAHARPGGVYSIAELEQLLK